MADKASVLERLRDRYRATYPHDKLILCIDRRPAARLAFVVIAIAANSAWFDLLPDEQMVEIVPDERPKRS